MSLEVDAIYENGTLKLVHPLPLSEKQKVRVTIDPPARKLKDSFGIMDWQGDPKVVQKIALDADCGVHESP